MGSTSRVGVLGIAEKSVTWAPTPTHDPFSVSVETPSSQTKSIDSIISSHRSCYSAAAAGAREGSGQRCAVPPGAPVRQCCQAQPPRCHSSPAPVPSPHPYPILHLPPLLAPLSPNPCRSHPHGVTHSPLQSAVLECASPPSAWLALLLTDAFLDDTRLVKCVKVGLSAVRGPQGARPFGSSTAVHGCLRCSAA